MSVDSSSRPWGVYNTDDGVLVAIPYEELDERKALLLVDDLFELMQRVERPNLFLDLSSVQTISSSVLAQLLVLDRTLHEAGGHLALFGLSPSICALLETTHLIDLLDIHGIPLPHLANLS
jgi:anti-anti-sigma factor